MIDEEKEITNMDVNFSYSSLYSSQSSLDTFNLVKSYSDTIKNDRTVFDVLQYAYDEMQELEAEESNKYYNNPPGSDGIIGEAIDVISCMLDIIVLENPTFTSDQFNSYLQKKCEKWKTKYHKGD